MFDAIAAGQIKALWIVTNPAHSMPDANKVREALAARELVIVQDAYADTDSIDYADAAAGRRLGRKRRHGDQLERRISRVRARRGCARQRPRRLGTSASTPPAGWLPDWGAARIYSLRRPG